MDNSVERAKIMLSTVSKMIESATSNLSHDTSKKAIIQSLNENNTANIIMNGQTYTNIKIRVGLLPQVNEVVTVCLPQNSTKDMYIDLCTTASTGNSENIGEVNTASNVGIAGVGVFKQKSGVDLQFKKINSGSSKVTITDDTTNSKVDIDVVTGTTSDTVAAGDDSRFLTSTQKIDLTDSGDSTLHYHVIDRDRANHSGTQIASTISDFVEASQDAIGNILTDTTTVDLVYDDTNNQIKANVNDNSSIQKIQVSKAGTLVGTRKKLNFIGDVVTIADDSTNDKLDITISGGSGGAKKASGTYTGNGSNGRFISCGFDPLFVVVTDLTDSMHWIYYGYLNTNVNSNVRYVKHEFGYSSLASDIQADSVIKLITNGFNVGSSGANVNGRSYYWAALG